MTDPLLATIDATPWIATILEACRSLGATITESRSSSCYTSRGVYGTPSYRSTYDPTTKTWRTQGPELDVTVYRAEWPMEQYSVRDPWLKRPTGPSMYRIAQACGVQLPAAWLAAVDAQPAGSGVLAILIYERAATLQANGDGRGVVLAQGRRPSACAAEDERGVPYLATNAAGALEIGVFAS